VGSYPLTAAEPSPVVARMLEHEIQVYLQEVRAVAEHRHGALRTGAIRLGSLSLLPSEQALRAAVEQQEEIEFGHPGHGRGVGRIALGLAEIIGLPDRQVEQLQRAALLHDAGKLALDSALWGARGTLRAEDRTLLEVHPRFGHDLAAEAGLPETVLQTILYHHERWDGRGYPHGLSQDDIPMQARILALAEVIDSGLRTTYRRPALTPHQVGAILENGAGSQWDPLLARKAARILRGH